MTSRDQLPDPARRRQLISPLVLAISYVVYAGLWILTSDSLLSLFVPAEQLARAGVIKGLAFVAVTGVILYLLLTWLVPGRSSAPTPTVPPGSPRRTGPVVVLVATILIVATITAGTYLNRAPALLEETRQELATIAALQADFIGSWKNERFRDAQVLRTYRGLQENATVLASDSEGSRAERARARIIERFNALRLAYDYKGIALVDATGTEIWVNQGIDHWPAGDLPTHVTHAAENEILELAPDLQTIRHSHLDLLIPIQHDEQLVAHVLLRANLPAIPRQNHASDSYLATIQEEHVLLIEQRQRQDIDEPRPLTPWQQDALTPDDFGPQATPRTFEGQEIAGERVIAATHPVPAVTGW